MAVAHNCNERLAVNGFPKEKKQMLEWGLVNAVVPMSELDAGMARWYFCFGDTPEGIQGNVHRRVRGLVRPERFSASLDGARRVLEQREKRRDRRLHVEAARELLVFRKIAAFPQTSDITRNQREC